MNAKTSVNLYLYAPFVVLAVGIAGSLAPESDPVEVAAADRTTRSGECEYLMERHLVRLGATESQAALAVPPIRTLSDNPSGFFGSWGGAHAITGNFSGSESHTGACTISIDSGLVLTLDGERIS